MIETENHPERVLIVGVQTENISDLKFETIMKEMKALTETANGLPVGEITQKLRRIDQKSVVGSGKLMDVRDFVINSDIDLVIFLNRLSPNTNMYLEEQLDVKVIDRVQLILDIFAQRARSQAGKLQVELAQYQYLLPRVIGQGTSLSRLAGGIGTRGPGETKLEQDRRVIRGRIHTIEKDLKQLEEHRERTRIRRQSGREFNIGLVGYTNAGKSTLLRELTESETYVQDQLFATLDPLTRKLEINGHDAFTITDTVGFIDELPTELIHAFNSTLEEIRFVDLLIHVVDASHPASNMHEDTVVELLKDLDMDHIPVLTVYNKIDKADTGIEPTLQPNVTISALDKKGIETLKQAIWDICISNAEEFQVEIQPEEAELLALYRQKTLIKDIEFNEEYQYYILSGYRRRLTDIRNEE
ncbi:GTPase HflX [Aerococcaceae bacterium INB8]|uniref:GTPase HflX n=1 Tax=Ruoffia halotolerans TaxID=2748684 RepID=A0A839A4S5_9LACT|nr:GTPase HflX [Ruoffia halotolerans]MBA5728820.1 GTPase HflX [Ruoffia halotolerans]